MFPNQALLYEARWIPLPTPHGQIQKTYQKRTLNQKSFKYQMERIQKTCQISKEMCVTSIVTQLVVVRHSVNFPQTKSHHQSARPHRNVRQNIPLRKDRSPVPVSPALMYHWKPIGVLKGTEIAFDILLEYFTYVLMDQIFTSVNVYFTPVMHDTITQ